MINLVFICIYLLEHIPGQIVVYWFVGASSRKEGGYVCHNGHSKVGHLLGRALSWM